jgi:hypothetical protein
MCQVKGSSGGAAWLYPLRVAKVHINIVAVLAARKLGTYIFLSEAIPLLCLINPFAYNPES